MSAEQVSAEQASAEQVSAEQASAEHVNAEQPQTEAMSVQQAMSVQLLQKRMQKWSMRVEMARQDVLTAAQVVALSGGEWVGVAQGMKGWAL